MFIHLFIYLPLSASYSLSFVFSEHRYVYVARRNSHFLYTETSRIGFIFSFFSFYCLYLHWASISLKEGIVTFCTLKRLVYVFLSSSFSSSSCVLPVASKTPGYRMEGLLDDTERNSHFHCIKTSCICISIFLLLLLPCPPQGRQDPRISNGGVLWQVYVPRCAITVLITPPFRLTSSSGDLTCSAAQKEKLHAPQSSWPGGVFFPLNLCAH